MGYSGAKRKKSNLTPQELMCVLYLLLMDEPGHQLRFKAIELADLTASGRLRTYCEYFHTAKVFRLSIKEDVFAGRTISLRPSGSLAMMHFKELTSRQVLKPEEMITSLYLAIMRRPERRFHWSLADFEKLKRRGEMTLEAKYFPAENTYILSARPDKDGQIIQPGTASLARMSGYKK
jgi:hypothetical protein